MLDFADIKREYEETFDITQRPGVTGRTYHIISDEGEVPLIIEVASHDVEYRFMVPVPNVRDVVRSFPDWKIINLSKHYPQHDNHQDEHLMLSLRVEDQEYLDVFCRLVQDLGASVANVHDADRRRSVLNQRLNQWNTFFRERRYGGLNEEQQRGLFGELHFLRTYLLPKLPHKQALLMWQGPDYRSQDFVNGDQHAVEVKTSNAKHGTHVKISSAHQLDDTAFQKLWLYALILDLESDYGDTLPSIVQEITNTLGENAANAAEFQRKLYTTGYLEEHVGKYSHTYFDIREEQMFRVTGAFPRILPRSEAIQNVRYELDLLQCQEHRASPVTDALKEFLA